MMRDWISETTEIAENIPVRAVNAAEKIGEVRAAIESVIRGKPETVKYALVGLFAKGHILIEDVPGIGKTTLANALSRVFELSAQRIQFTSDLLPSDVVGLSIFNQRSGDFEWRPGPIFSNVVLADEINRATPKTQSALLEAMSEEQVTVDGVSRELPAPFMVIATQNPAEHHGTFPLPESQLDRFMLRLHLGYPEAGTERRILRDRETEDPLESLKPVLSRPDVIALQRSVAAVRMDDALLDYLLEVVDATRNAESIELGVSPRGALALFRSAQALALVESRDYCVADDIKRLVIPCFAHRIMISTRTSGLRQRTREAETILHDILQKTAVPV